MLWVAHYGLKSEVADSEADIKLINSGNEDYQVSACERLLLM